MTQSCHVTVSGPLLYVFLQALQLYMIDFLQDLRVSFVWQGVSAVVECDWSWVFGLVSSMYCIS
jgi:hypothetical protein